MGSTPDAGEGLARSDVRQGKCPSTYQRARAALSSHITCGLCFTHNLRALLRTLGCCK
jgi:hypothetical protein